MFDGKYVCTPSAYPPVIRSVAVTSAREMYHEPTQTIYANSLQLPRREHTQ